MRVIEVWLPWGPWWAWRFFFSSFGVYTSKRPHWVSLDYCRCKARTTSGLCGWKMMLFGLLGSSCIGTLHNLFRNILVSSKTLLTESTAVIITALDVDCRQPRTFFFQSHVFVMCAECGFPLYWWKMHERHWETCSLEGSMVLLHFCVLFCTNPVVTQQ